MANRWICVNGHTLKEQPSRPACPFCGAALAPLVPVGVAEDEVYETIQPTPARVPDRGPTLLPPALAAAPPRPAPEPEEDEADRTAMPPAPPPKTEVPNGRPTFPAPPHGVNDAQTLVPPPASGPPTPSLGPGPSASGFQVLPGYEILGVLGRGGMGVVYKARQSGLNRVVALKMIISGPHASDEELNRFKTEAEAVAALKHPNIVQIHDMGVRDGRPYFSLEFCEGGSLQGRLDGTPMPPAAAARLLRTLADAVGYAHGQHIIHRDLKPANILLLEGKDHPLERCTPKITDFGLAKKLGDEQGNTATEAILGTPTYMAPEQAQGRTRQAGPEADVYALGAILYDLLTGRPPFKGASALDTIQMVQTAEPVPPTRLQPGVPADLQTITLKCLEKDPKKRYATAADLAADLSRFLEGRPIQARPVSTAELAWKFVRRNKLLTALLAALILAPTVLAVVMWLYSEQLKVERNKAVSAEGKAKAEMKRAETAEGKATKEMERAIIAEGKATDEMKRAMKAEEAAQESFLKVQKAIERLLRLSEARLRHVGGTDETRTAMLEDALQMGQMLLVRQGESPTATIRAALGHRLYGDMLEKRGKHDEALRHFEQSAALLKGVLKDRPDQTEEAVWVEILRWKVLEANDRDRAAGVLDAALARLDALPPELRDGRGVRWARAAVLANRAIHHQNRSAPELAMRDLDAAARILAALARDEEGSRLEEVNQERARVLANRAALKLAGSHRDDPLRALAAAAWPQLKGGAGALKEAEADCDRAIKHFEGLLKTHHTDPELLKELGRVLTTKGLVLTAQGRVAEARALAERAVARFRVATREAQSFVDPRHLLGLALSDQGLYEYQARDYAAAVATLEEARRVLGALTSEFPTEEFRRSLARADTTYSLTLMKRGKFDEARALLESTLAWFRKVRDAEGAELVRTNLMICRDQLSRDAERIDPRGAAEHLEALAALRRDRLAELPAKGDWRAMVKRILAATELLFTLQAQARLLDDARDYRTMSRVVEEMERLAGRSWPGHIEQLPPLARAITVDRMRAKSYGELALRLLGGQKRSRELDEFLAAADLAPIRALAGYRDVFDSLPRP